MTSVGLKKSETNLPSCFPIGCNLDKLSRPLWFEVRPRDLPKPGIALLNAHIIMARGNLGMENQAVRMLSPFPA